MSKQKCKHRETKEVITAKEVEIQCSGCKDIVHSRTRVLSSNIYAVGRIGKKTEIQFMNAEKGPGAVYISVEDIPRDLHEGLLRAKSVGSYFHAHMKSEYEFIPLEGK